MKVLVLGAQGQLGRCLNDQLKRSNYDIILTSRNEIDISDINTAKKKIRDIAPQILINASAYTEVDKAEEEKKTADLINHLAVANIARVCCEIECYLIHFSTDYVFDGRGAKPYLEIDKTNPQGAYGKTKLKGELAIKKSSCKYMIIRTSWVYSEYGNNFLKTMLKLGADRDQLNVVGDQIGCPTYAQDIAKNIIKILSSIELKGLESGIYHYCGDIRCSWYDFACAIFSEAELQGLKTPRSIKSISTLDYPTKATRPAYSVLDCTKIEQSFDISRSNLRYGIRTVIDKLKSQC